MAEKNVLPENLYCLTIKLPLTEHGAFEEFLTVLELGDWSSETSHKEGKALFHVYCESKGKLEDLQEHLQEKIVSEWRTLFNGSTPEWSSSTIEYKDWSETWKSYFHTFKATDRIVIKPTWEEYDAQPHEIVLEIDPGMSFGTGYHGTTLACLDFMDHISRSYPNVSFLDAGCGSGILTAAASRLGFSPIYAFDYDSAAVSTTWTNLHVNEINQDIHLETADLRKYRMDRRFHVVAANILAPILLDNAHSLSELVAMGEPPGYLILSGITDVQYPAVKKCFERLGFREESRRTIGEWVSGCFTCF